MAKKSGFIISLVLSCFLLFSPPGFAGIRTDLKSEFYFRFADDDQMKGTFELPGIELNPAFTLVGESGDLLTLAFQIYSGGAMSGPMKDMHYGNAYLLIPTGLGKPTFKLGQQIIPFGQLAEYDTHSQIIQNLYAKSLGLRIDTGVSVYGMLGDYDYWFMVSNGTGPNRIDADRNKVITGRIAKTFQVGNSDLRLGVSALCGNLPHYMPGEDVYQDMMGMPKETFTETKTRYALDAEYSGGPILFRGELVAGKNKLDTGTGVIYGDAFGYYMELRYPLSNRIEILGKYDYWRPYAPLNETTTSKALEINFAMNKNLELQFAAERFNNYNISGIPAERDRVTVQIGAFL